MALAIDLGMEAAARTARAVGDDAQGRCGPGAQHALPCHDPAQLGALLRGLEPQLLALALRFTRDAEDARDVVQSAFEKALRHCGRFRGESRVSTWLHRIVVNESLMWLRARRRRARVSVRIDDLDAVAPQDPAPSAAELLAQRQGAARGRRGLASLRPDERDVLLRCALEGRSYAQYGAERGEHVAAVKTRAFRARRRLLALVEQA